MIRFCDNHSAGLNALRLFDKMHSGPDSRYHQVDSLNAHVAKGNKASYTCPSSGRKFDSGSLKEAAEKLQLGQLLKILSRNGALPA